MGEKNRSGVPGAVPRDAGGAPGARWRFLAHQEQGSLELENQGVFDELVVDDWLHIEQMDETVWWMRLGDARIMVTVVAGARPIVDIERASYDAVNGQTTISAADQTEDPR
jgi:hypothetical protein